MQKTTWIRLGLAAVLLNGAFASILAAGCSGDDTTATSSDASVDRSAADAPGNDSGDSGTDAAIADGGPDGDATVAPLDAEAGPPVAKVFLVHASPDAPALRFCFALPTDGGSSVFNIPASPDTSNPAFPYPGLFPGFGGPLDTHGLDPSAATFQVFAIKASAVAGQSASGGPDGGAEAKCTELLGATATGGLVSPSDFFYAGTFHQGMFARGTTWLVALVGCLAGENGSGATLCPSGYTADAGNLTFLPWQLDRTTVVDGTHIGAQFAQASSAWDNVSTALGGAVTAAGFRVPAPVADAGSDALDLGDAVTLSDASDASDAADAAAAADADDASAEAAVSAADAAEAASPAASTVFVPVVLDAKYGDLKPMPLKAVAGVTFDGTSAFAAQAIMADGGTVAVRTLWPLVSTAAQPLSVQALTWGATPPPGAALANGSGYVFVLVGNPGDSSPTVNPMDGGPAAPDAGGVFNGHFPHILAFPTK